MDIVINMSEQITRVRTEARVAFEEHCRSSRERQRAGAKFHDRVERRRKWKELNEALMLHACRYAALKAAEANRAVPMVISRKLGTSDAANATEWMKTRLARLQCLKKERTEKSRRTSTSTRTTVTETKTERIDVSSDVVRTILPEWIRNVRASHHATYLRECAALIAVTPPACILVQPFAPVDDDSGYAQYVSRATASRASGVLISRPLKSSAIDIPVKYAEADTSDAVSAIYCNRPDEIYRRVSSKRFARYRRSKTDVEIAEAEMCRRRGADRLHTARGVNDPTVMVFDGGEHAYAFSSRISEAPRLRGRMVRKYTSAAPQPLVARPEGVERAIEFAENAPMFHTRVMDRFR